MSVENVGQPVVLRTNEEARKALVKSKDGRVKWLTVSADPAEPSWEECVRSWARKLGVCAQPSPSTPDTPLATPPPDGPGKHWLYRETVDDPTTAAPDVQRSTVEQKMSRKEAAQSKRTGSSTFARGFLLGLGGVGSSSSSSSSSSSNKSRGKLEVDVDVDDTVVAPHSTLPGIQTLQMEEGVESGTTCGRERWVKGFKGAPSSPTNSSTDGDASIDASKSSSDGPSLSNSTKVWLETVHSSNNSGDSSMASKGKKKKSKGGKAKGKCGKARANKSSVSKGNMTQVDAFTSGSTKQGKDNKKSTLNVTFGSVTLMEFTRDVGGCTVPSDGTWALSLGLPFRETRVDVDVYEASKAEILLERALKLSKKQRNLATGETRQFDHRPVGERNPLFGRLEEKERSTRLLDYACFHNSDHEEAYRDNHEEDLGGPLYKVSHSDFVDKSQEAAAELVALRKSRRSSQGCSCACFRADKLNVAKLRGELGKRGLKASGSKKDLTKMLQDAMRQENEEQGTEAHKVCRSDDCQCVRDGVECHADLCNCCKGPNIGKKDAHHGGNCGNPMGVYAYNSSIVRAYREQYVTAKSVSAQERWHVRSNSIGSEHH